MTLEQDVEHEALLLLMAQRAGVRCPALRSLCALDDGSMALAVEYVDGRRLDELSPDEIDADLLDRVLATGRTTARRAPGAPLAARRQHPRDRGAPVVIDFGFGTESAGERAQAIDRAELLVSLAVARRGRARRSRRRRATIGVDALASAAPYLQPLALSAATRKQASKAMLRELRDGIATTTGEAPVPLEQLVRVRARTLVMIAALSAAFYVLLPQLADVGDSIDALGSANWWWLAVCVVMSIGTYLFAAIGLAGGVPEHLPFVPNLAAQMASSFVNRVTPANVGGMALNLRFLQKAGVAPAEAVTGIGLNVAAGGVAHLLLLLSCSWRGRVRATRTASRSRPAARCWW